MENWRKNAYGEGIKKKNRGSNWPHFSFTFVDISDELKCFEGFKPGTCAVVLLPQLSSSSEGLYLSLTRRQPWRDPPEMLNTIIWILLEVWTDTALQLLPHPVGLLHLKHPFYSLEQQLLSMKKASKQQTTPFLQILLTVCVLQGSLISRHRIKGLRQITYTSKETNVLCSLPHPLCCCTPGATLSSLQPAHDGKHHKQWLKSSSGTSNVSAQVFTSFSGWGANRSNACICHNRNTSLGLSAANTAPLLATLSYL